MIKRSPLKLTTCFSPDFGTIEDEQFFYDITTGELEIDVDNLKYGVNLGYFLVDGTSNVFVYRHFFENSFNIIDDEVEDRVLFQVDENVDSFTIDTAEEFEAA